MIMVKVDIATFKEQSRVENDCVGKSQQKERDITRVFLYRQTEKEKVPEEGQKERRTYVEAAQ